MNKFIYETFILNSYTLQNKKIQKKFQPKKLP